MGYEVIFHYHEKNEDGPGYDTSETKQLKRAVGDVYEETSPEKLASAIISQMARRDIWVVDVEVFEFARKKLAFRETKGGVVIGNRKYSFDQCDGSVCVQEIPVPAPEPLRVTPVQRMPAEVQRQAPAPLHISEEDALSGENLGDALYFRNTKPLREEVFAPKDKALARLARESRMPFTMGKNYAIYAEKPAPGGVMAGMLYTVRDDNGRRNVVSDKFFDLKPKLFAGELFDDVDALSADTLNAEGMVDSMQYMDDSMPQLRPRS